MNTKKKMKKSAKAVIVILMLLICIALVLIIVRSGKSSKPETSHAVELEGDIEIIIPEEQDSDGF